MRQERFALRGASAFARAKRAARYRHGMLLAACALAGANHAAADENPAAPGSGASSDAAMPPSFSTRAAQSTPIEPQVLAPVTVTVDKHIGTEQTTPAALRVYSGAALDAAGVTNVETLSAISPDLSYSRVGMVGPVVTLRGISSRDVTEIGDPAVLVATDGTYVNRPYALFGALYDLERIEVLRGPQGTLYGRNAIGGLIDITTAKPTHRLEGSATAEVGDYATRNVAATVNVPVNDVVQFRVAAESRRHRGYLDNAPGPSGDDEDVRSGRFTLAVQPSRDFHALLTVQQTTIKGVGPVSLDIPYVMNPDGSVSHDKPTFPGDPRRFTVPTPASLDISDTLARWNFTYDLPNVELTYIGGIDSLTYHHAGDATPIGTAPLSYRQNESPKTQNHELRVASRGDSRWGWQAGLSYFSETSALYSANETLFSDGRFLPTLAFDYGVHAASAAVFGQTSYQLTEQVRLSAGARLTRDEKGRAGNYFFANNDTPPLTYTYVPADDASTSHKATWHLGVDWAPNAQTLAYAKFDTGYKAGGFTFTSPYGPETVYGVEIGSKMRLFDNRAQLNLAAFHYNYTGQQVQQLVAFADGRTGTNIVNAGRTSISGVEASASALVEPVGRIDLAIDYLHARFKDFLVDDGTGHNIQAAGNAPAQSPAISLALGVEHRSSIPTGRVIERMDLRFRSAQHLTFYNYPDDLQKPYVTLDLSATYVPYKSNYEVQCYVRNVTNTQVFVAAEEYRFDNAYRYAFAAPRTIGVKATVYW